MKTFNFRKSLFFKVVTLLVCRIFLFGQLVCADIGPVYEQDDCQPTGFSTEDFVKFYRTARNYMAMRERIAELLRTELPGLDELDQVFDATGDGDFDYTDFNWMQQLIRLSDYFDYLSQSKDKVALHGEGYDIFTDRTTGERVIWGYSYLTEVDIARMKDSGRMDINGDGVIDDKDYEYRKYYREIGRIGRSGDIVSIGGIRYRADFGEFGLGLSFSSADGHVFRSYNYFDKDNPGRLDLNFDGFANVYDVYLARQFWSLRNHFEGQVATYFHRYNVSMGPEGFISEITTPSGAWKYTYSTNDKGEIFQINALTDTHEYEIIDEDGLIKVTRMDFSSDPPAPTVPPDDGDDPSDDPPDDGDDPGRGPNIPPEDDPGGDDPADRPDDDDQSGAAPDPDEDWRRTREGDEYTFYFPSEWADLDDLAKRIEELVTALEWLFDYIDRLRAEYAKNAKPACDELKELAKEVDALQGDGSGDSLVDDEEKANPKRKSLEEVSALMPDLQGKITFQLIDETLSELEEDQKKEFLKIFMWLRSKDAEKEALTEAETEIYEKSHRLIRLLMDAADSLEGGIRLAFEGFFKVISKKVPAGAVKMSSSKNGTTKHCYYISLEPKKIEEDAASGKE